MKTRKTKATRRVRYSFTATENKEDRLAYLAWIVDAVIRQRFPKWKRTKVRCEDVGKR